MKTTPLTNFLHGFGLALGETRPSLVRDMWAAYSRQLSDRQRREYEVRGTEEDGIKYGQHCATL